MKTCNTCNQSLPLKQFSKRGAGHQSKCKECTRAYYQNYYQTNPAERKRLDKQRDERRAEINAFLRQAKSVPCADCYIQYPYYVMQFDHLGDKEFTIASAGRTKNLEQIKAEVLKCEVVCANCHAERTWG